MRLAVYLCVFGVLAGCHAFLDPEGDYLRPGTPPTDDAGPPLSDAAFDAGTDGGPDAGPDGGADAGPPPGDDAGAMDAGPDAGPVVVSCDEILTYNANRPIMTPPCCAINEDCVEGVCVHPACGGDTPRAGFCVPTSPPGVTGRPCLIDAQCPSGRCDGGVDALPQFACASVVPMPPPGTCAAP